LIATTTATISLFFAYFGCIESCIFPDFEDYVEPFEVEGMSEEEEDYLDYLLGDENEEIQDSDEV
jgi:hypothetical protein